MAWEIIETPNAKYVLIFGTHIQNVEKSPINFDALVLETGGMKPEIIKNFGDYKGIIDQAVEGNKQIWLTDVKPTSKSQILRIIARSFLVASPSLIHPALVTIPIATDLTNIGLGFTKGPIKFKGFRKTVNKFSNWGKTGIIHVRDAITAEKVENFVAPALKRDDAKPTITMVWGGGHYGIKELLLHPIKRRKILAKHKLEKWVQADYQKTFSFHLDRNGNIINMKEHALEVKPKEETPKREAPPKRPFFRRIFRRP